MKEPFMAAAVQFPIDMGDVAANRERAFRLVREAAAKGARLCVLPEMWSSGFDNENLRRHAGTTPAILEGLSSLARETGTVIAGSLPERVGRGVCNTLYVIGADGKPAGSYRKAHLFSPSGEDRWFRRGAGASVIPTPFGAAGPLICYDIRFPELARKYFLAGATLLLVPAQWPAARKSHWDALLAARAIENQLFVVAANATGTSGPFTFPGGSVIVSPTGERLAEGGTGEGVVIAEIDPKKADDFRRRIPCAADRNVKSYRQSRSGS
jgi:predicted amidohydrolase